VKRLYCLVLTTVTSISPLANFLSNQCSNITNPKLIPFSPKPPTPCQGASSITEMMDHHTDCNKERPNGVAGGLSLRKGAFLHENLSSARKKQSSSLNPFIEGFPIKQYPPHYIDKYARKIFPLLFGLFNIIYWSYYLPRR